MRQLQPGMPASVGRRSVIFSHINEERENDCHQRQAAVAMDAKIAKIAVRCLYTELSLYPKPGLVSLIDNGSHTDMNATSFMRSLFALRHYFKSITQAGYEQASFSQLKKLGIAAEQRMMLATKGINTHRGAIFSLGMLCATTGCLSAQNITPTPDAIRQTLLEQWGTELRLHGQNSSPESDNTSNGIRVAQRHGASGAREEIASGLPSVFDIALPALCNTLNAGRTMYEARIDTFFALMAHISDTNVYHRGGADGAMIVKEQAQSFINAGGTAHPDWYHKALACHQLFSAKRLSPGGAADLLAATCFVHEIHEICDGELV